MDNNQQEHQEQQEQRAEQPSPQKNDMFRSGWQKLNLWRSYYSGSTLKTLIMLAIVMLAYREGLFDQVPGVKELLEIGFGVASEICGFLADLLTKLYELLHIDSIWNFIRSIVQ